MNSNIKKLLEKNSKNKKVIVIDWLTITADDFLNHTESTDSLDFNGVIITQIPEKRTKHFNKIFEIHYQGERVATMTAQSISKTILVNRCQIKFENHLFYNGQAQWVYEVLKSRLELKNISISRLDIAVDGVWLHPFVNHFYYEQENKDFARVADRDNIFPIGFSRIDMRNRSFDSFVVGSFGSKREGKSKSDRFIRYYNKSREIRDISDKTYISDFHEANLLGNDGDVYRFEMSVNSKWLNDHSVRNVEYIFEQEYLIKLFTTSLTKFFEFRTIEGKNISRGEVINLFGEYQSLTYIQKVKKLVTSGIRTIKSGVKRLIESCVMGAFSRAENAEKKHILENSIFSIIEVYGLHDWFSKVAPFWWDEFQKRARKEQIQLSNSQFKLFV